MQDKIAEFLNMPALGGKTASLLVIAVFLLLVDRFLKSMALAEIWSHVCCGGWLAFVLAPNYGIAFSLPLTGPYVASLILLICLLLSVYILKLWNDGRSRLALCLLFMLVGAWSNLYDRFVYGYVVDYFYLKYFSIFNVADAMISLSALVFVWLVWREEKNA